MSPIGFTGLLAVADVLSAQAQKPPLPMPPAAGVSVVQTLRTPEGDRESVHTVAEATAGGLRWTWQLVEVHPSGDTIRQRFRYAELYADLADAIRSRAYHDAQAPEEHPGYTMHARSRAAYRRLRATDRGPRAEPARRAGSRLRGAERREPQQRTDWTAAGRSRDGGRMRDSTLLQGVPRGG